MPFILRGIVQLVERRSPKPYVEGSSPSAPAMKYCKIDIMPTIGFAKPSVGINLLTEKYHRQTFSAKNDA